MVRGLVQDEHVRFAAQHIRQRHALQLTAGEMRDGLVVVADVQLRQVFLYASRLLLALPQTCLHDRHLLRIDRRLLQVGYT